jgi:hypothetical protein
LTEGNPKQKQTSYTHPSRQVLGKSKKEADKEEGCFGKQKPITTDGAS